MTNHYVAGCTGKKKYATQTHAAEVGAGVSAKQKKGARMYTYQCEACGCWHLSHLSPQKERAHRAEVMQSKLRVASAIRRATTV